MLILPRPGWKAGNAKGADHGLVYAYDTHIPLLFMGWKIRQGATDRAIGMTDIAPTLAALLQVQMPSGCIGQPIEEITTPHRSSSVHPTGR
jgi:arylsulfatase A-like enzyme